MARKAVRVAVSLLTLMILPPDGAFGELIYDKLFIADGAAPDAKIEAGALVETWAGDDQTKNERLTITPGIVRLFDHAKLPTDSQNINGATRDLVLKPTDLTVADGFTNKTTATDGPAHNESNTAKATVFVFNLLSSKNFKWFNPKTGKEETIDLGRGAVVGLSGSAAAGKPTDPDKDLYHSADSWAAAKVAAARIFRSTGGRLDDSYRLYEINTMFSGTSAKPGSKGKVLDPLFMTVTDLETGVVLTQAVMLLALEYEAATFSLDDAGMRFVIDRGNPNSFVSLVFSSEGPWVEDPYSYGARLDAAGFSAFGSKVPRDDWRITMTPETTEAFFPFSAGGVPADFAEILPPLTVGHRYQYDVGGSDGVFEIASRVSAPSSALLLGAGVLALAAVMGRRRLRAGAERARGTAGQCGG